MYLRCEKQQVAALGEYLLALLDDLSPDVEPIEGHGSVTPLPFAWDVGSMDSKGPDGDLGSQRYLVVLRRGVQTWQISSVAVVPQTPVTATQ